MRAWTTKLILILTLGLAGVSGGMGIAADWSVVPSVDLRSSFNSNLNYDFQDKISDYIFSLRPQIDFNYATDISQLQARLRPTALHYITNSNLDTIDQNYQINGRYQVLPRLNLTLSSAYIVDSTLQQELVTSGVFMNRTARTSILVNPGLAFALTERLLANLTYTFNSVGYEDPLYRDYTNQGVNLGLDYMLSNEKTTLRSIVNVVETRYPQNDYWRALGLYGGFNHKFTEDWDATILAGVNLTQLSFTTVTLDLTNFPFFIQVQQNRQVENSVQPYVEISTTKLWSRASFTAGFLRNQSPSAYGGVYETNRLFSNISYEFTEKLRAGLNGYFSVSDNTSERSNIRQTYIFINPQLTYRITEKLAITPAYSFGFREDRVNKQTTDQHVVWLALHYSYPIHAQY